MTPQPTLIKEKPPTTHRLPLTPQQLLILRQADRDVVRALEAQRLARSMVLAGAGLDRGNFLALDDGPVPALVISVEALE